ncbi:hypothetical protein PVAND_000957 [Polypedilum vanderplanki]|uniref:Carboxylic ester hydrolase n=1 Tax=Polypedilum vanderplanki TaxID=319348 RepID=A0A9J6BM34_POLVA|nr:hypothetical protein PVAND_000957 [Polypedilum vanderplanki]
MKVKLFCCCIWTLLIIYKNAAAIQPSTFGSYVDSFGRITNTIKDTNAWKRFNGFQNLMQQRPQRFMRVVQEFVRGIRQEERHVVKTKMGALRGRYQAFKTGVKGGYFSFQGIRYGKAPSGERRFRAALPEGNWNGIRTALREGPSCPHRNMILDNFRGNEDCLFLNVYTPFLPENNTNPKLPILFYIHGGAFQFGNGNSFLFGPDYFMESKEIILVTMNYRLGALGFLNTGTVDAPGNVGLKDQVLALKWVRDNIEFFGGDKHEITIGGQSAGSASVHYHILSPLSKGLFKRAILQSGVSISPWALSDIPHERAFSLGKALNFVTNDTNSLIQFLRKVTPQKIVDASPKTLTLEDARKNIGLAFVPSIEKVFPTTNDTDPEYDQPFLTEHPLKILREGRFNKVPLMLGFNAHEAMLFIRRFKKDKTLLSQYENDFVRLVPLDLNVTGGRFSTEADLVADRIRDFYLGGRPISMNTVEEMILLLTDLMFVRGMTNTAKIHGKYSRDNIYFYRFAYDGALGLYKRLLNVNRPGVCHGDELGYLFYFGFFNVKIDATSSEANVKSRLLRLWTNFVKFGNPTPKGKADQLLNLEWNPINSTSPYQIPYLDITTMLEMKKNPEQERMEFWDDLYEQYNGDFM